MTRLLVDFRSHLNQLLGASLRFRLQDADWPTVHRLGSYGHPEILARVEAATRAVLQGQAVAERDGRALQVLPAPGPALPALLLASRQPLFKIIDFGGGLASHWLAWRPWLQVNQHQWHIVEQPSFVEAGQRLFHRHSVVAFHSHLDAALGACPEPDAILASSVLPYLEDPHRSFSEFLSARPRWIIVDRTPFLDTGTDHLSLQINPRRNGGRRYPCWLFALNAFRDEAAIAGYESVLEWPGSDGVHRADGRRVSYRGFALRRKDVR